MATNISRGMKRLASVVFILWMVAPLYPLWRKIDRAERKWGEGGEFGETYIADFQRRCVEFITS